MRTPVAIRAAKCVAHFNATEQPGWKKRINPATLDIGNERTCFIAQMAGMRYIDAMAHYGIPTSRAVELGLNGDSDFDRRISYEQDCRELTAALRAELAK